MHTTIQYTAGVDEAGRGPLVGSVVAAAVILDPQQAIIGLADSKKLSAKKRELLYQEICQKALCYAIAEATAAEIDELNILHASLLAMQRAVLQLALTPQQVLIDGNHCPQLPSQYNCEAIVKGDSKESCISAASILAKVTRDRQMLALDQQYPCYGFAQHKGYPTKDHLLALQQHGPIALHRRSFAPVRKLEEEICY